MVTGKAQQTNLPETTQSQEWRGDFGKEWSARNRFTPGELDRVYQSNYGMTRTELNQRFLTGLSRSLSILEVGCNLGNQLLVLQEMGFTNLHGIEIQTEIVKQAQTRLPSVNVVEGSALRIPYPDASFDLVFTSGVLIHIAPQDLPTALSEIHRCSRTWTWGLEYYAPQMTEILYRGHQDLMWKADYAQLFLQKFPDLELVREGRLAYLGNNNVDAMYLLRRSRQ
jgi:pseudaminic acid biosynthesis-associated methylase